MSARTSSNGYPLRALASDRELRVRRRRILFVLLASLLATVAARAHHSVWAEFDNGRPLELRPFLDHLEARYLA